MKDPVKECQRCGRDYVSKADYEDALAKRPKGRIVHGDDLEDVGPPAPGEGDHLENPEIGMKC